ncbi:MAG: NUDIX domain-containing protein [Burkholderiales bacterium]|nr:NUDIX domain-containing protein [Bacteroidia bacterium]
MNITIYYLSKKIIVTEGNQRSENQSFINIDNLKKSELLDEFAKFAHQKDQTLLTFVTINIEQALEKFRKPFKYIFAAGGLIQKDDKYLFIFRLKRWDLPKGKLDMGEGPEEAAIRECEEECGITKLTITKTLEPTYHIYDHKGGFALKKTFWYDMTTKHEGILVPQLEENIEEVVWFNKSQIQEQVLPNSYPAILSVIRNNI